MEKNINQNHDIENQILKLSKKLYGEEFGQCLCEDQPIITQENEVLAAELSSPMLLAFLITNRHVSPDIITVMQAAKEFQPMDLFIDSPMYAKMKRKFRKEFYYGIRRAVMDIMVNIETTKTQEQKELANEPNNNQS